MQFCVPLKGDSRRISTRFDRKTLRSSLQKADSSIGATCDPRVDGENMASFPDLRPNRRSAKAESTAAPGNRARLLLAVSTALLLTASLAVSELATLRGARAHDASVFLTRELGPPLDRPLVRTPAHATPGSSSPPSAGSSRSATAASRSRRARQACRFASAARGAPGRLTSTASSGSCRSAARRSCSALNSVEQSLTVDEASGHANVALATRCRKPSYRVTPDGTVRFADAKKRRGTPNPPRRHLRQGSARTSLRAGFAGRSCDTARPRWLQLRLNDAELPLPYVIDPIALVAACPGGGCANNTTHERDVA